MPDAHWKPALIKYVPLPKDSEDIAADFNEDEINEKGSSEDESIEKRVLQKAIIGKGESLMSISKFTEEKKTLGPFPIMTLPAVLYKKSKDDLLHLTRSGEGAITAETRCPEPEIRINKEAAAVPEEDSQERFDTARTHQSFIYDSPPVEIPEENKLRNDTINYDKALSNSRKISSLPDKYEKKQQEVTKKANSIRTTLKNEI